MSIMLKPKKSLTLLDVLAVVRELKQLLVNKFIDKVFRLEDGVILRIRTDVDKIYLLISKHRLGITKYISEEERKRDPILKNFLERTRIVDIYNPVLDRIVHFKLSNNMTLIVELIEPQNIILVDESGTVKWCLHKYESKDRKIAVGLKYTPPPRQFLDVLNCSVEAFLANISGSKNFLKTAARVLGVGVELISEACLQEGVNCEGEISREEALKVLERVRQIIRQVIEGQLSPTVYIKDNMYITVTPIEFKIYENLEKLKFSSFNEAVDEYFRRVELQEVEQSKVREIEVELTKLRKSIEQTEQTIREYEEKVCELQEKAQKVLMYKYVLEEFLQLVNKLWLEYKDEFENIVRDLQHDVIKVVDYNPREKTLVVKIEDCTVAIPLRKSVGEIINELFEKAKEFKRKVESAKKALEELKQREQELLSKREEVIEKFRKSIVEIEYGVHEWFEKYKWFITSNGYLVLAGKDASQNEALVRKYLRDFDIFLHADIPGAAAVIVRVKRKDDTPPPEDIQEAARYAAANSKAWVLGHTVVDVYYVRGSQVSKEAPAGEYLAKGSFMIYGSREWLRNVRLELAVGIRVDEVQEGKKIVRIISTPPEVADRHCEYYVILRPGRLDKNKCANILREKFMKYVRDKYGITPRISPEDVIIHIPGNSDIVEERVSNNVLPWSEIKARAQ